MIIETNTQYRLYKKAADTSTEILRQLYDMATVGAFPIEIDEKAFELCKKYSVSPSFYGVQGYKSTYKHATCIAINDEAVHGIPSKIRPLQNGDLVKIDFGIIQDSYVTDQCVTVGIGSLKHKDAKLIEVGKQAVLAGVMRATAQNTTGDIGFAIEHTAREHRFDTIKHYIGHGIGHSLHEEPEVPATGRPHTGTQLETGMVICVEAQVVAGKPSITTDRDGWTVRTKDGKNAVMFEYMVMVKDDTPEILTDTRDWALIKN